MKDKLLFAIIPSITEIVILFFMSFHAFFPMESGFMLWHHLKLGERDYATRRINTTNPFSYLAGNTKLKRSSWASDIGLYFTYRKWNYRGLIILKMIILLFVLTGVLFLSIKHGHSLVLAIFFPFLYLLIGPATAMRPTLFSLLFFVLFVYFIQHRRPYWASLIIIVWSQFHGSYIIGTGLIFLYLLKYKNKKWFFSFLIALLPLFIPYTSGIGQYTSFFRKKFVWGGFNEWLSPNFKSGSGIAFLIYIFFFLMALRKIRGWSFIIHTGIFFTSLWARRFIPYFVIFTYPFVTEYVSTAFDNSGIGRALSGIEDINKKTFFYPFYLFLFLTYFIFKTPSFKSYFLQKDHPYACAVYLKHNNIKGRILTTQSWADYIYFYLYPDVKVAVSGVLGVPDSVIKRYNQFMYLEKNWEEALSVLNPDFIILPMKNPYYSLRNCNGCLKIVHIGRNFAIFQKPVFKDKDFGNESVIKKVSITP